MPPSHCLHLFVESEVWEVLAIQRVSTWEGTLKRVSQDRDHNDILNRENILNGTLL